MTSVTYMLCEVRPEEFEVMASDMSSRIRWIVGFPAIFAEIEPGTFVFWPNLRDDAVVVYEGGRPIGFTIRHLTGLPESV